MSFNGGLETSLADVEGGLDDGNARWRFRYLLPCGTSADGHLFSVCRVRPLLSLFAVRASLVDARCVVMLE